MAAYVGISWNYKRVSRAVSRHHFETDSLAKSASRRRGTDAIVENTLLTMHGGAQESEQPPPPTPTQVRSKSKFGDRVRRLLGRKKRSSKTQMQIADLLKQVNKGFVFFKELERCLVAAVDDQEQMHGAFSEATKAFATAEPANDPSARVTGWKSANEMVRNMLHWFMPRDNLTDMEKDFNAMYVRLPPLTDVRQAMKLLQRKESNADVWEIVGWVALVMALGSMVAVPFFIPAVGVAIGSVAVTAVSHIRTHFSKLHDEERGILKEIRRSIADFADEWNGVNYINFNGCQNMGIIEEHKELRSLANNVQRSLDSLLKDRLEECTIDQRGLYDNIKKLDRVQHHFLMNLQEFLENVKKTRGKIEEARNQIKWYAQSSSPILSTNCPS